jgi:hypothetical protein
LLDGEAVTPVRAHPISAPEEGVSLTGADGHERAWIALLADLPDAQQGLLRGALAARELHPQLLRLVAVSTFSTPSLWTVETDHGPLQFHLKSEEDIRRLGGPGEGRLLDHHQPQPAAACARPLGAGPPLAPPAGALSLR